MGVDQVIAHVGGVTCGVADPVQALDLGQPARQAGKPAFSGVGVDVLTQQGDLAHALGRQVARLGQDRFDRPRPLPATGVRHDAEGAELVAALLHGEKSGDAGGVALHRQGVELLVGGEVGGQPLAALAMRASDKFGQLVIGLRSDNQIHRLLADHDLFALGLGHAAGHHDHHRRAGRDAGLLHLLDIAKLGIDLLGGLFTDVAGVQHHQIGALGLIRHAIAQRRKDVGHALAVIDVHLTAVGLDVEALGWSGHGRVYGAVDRLAQGAEQRARSPAQRRNRMRKSPKISRKPRRGGARRPYWSSRGMP